MRSILFWAGVAGGMVLSVGALAQETDPASEQWIACKGGLETGYAPQESVIACNGLIVAGGLAQKDLARAHDERGMWKSVLGDKDGALADLDKAVTLDPEDPEHYLHRAMIRQERKEQAEAMADLDRALQKDPRHYQALLMRGQTHLAAARQMRALADFDAAVAAKPDRFEAYLYRGIMYARANYCDAAAANFEQVLKLKPGHDQATGLAARTKRQRATGQCKALPTGSAAFVDVSPAAAGAVEPSADGASLKVALEHYNQKDYPVAFKLLSELAAKGDPIAQLFLGFMHENGRGVPVSPSEAVKWYRASADGGNSDGQFFLGLAYFQGRGVIKNYVEAARLFKASADKGNSEGLAFLGYVHLSGYGVPKDQRRAVEFFRRAALMDNARAQYWMATSNLYGHGVSVNQAKAYGWLLISSKNGSEAAVKLLKQIEPALSSDKIAEGQALAAECVSSGFKACRL